MPNTTLFLNIFVKAEKENMATGKVAEMIAKEKVAHGDSSAKNASE